MDLHLRERNASSRLSVLGCSHSCLDGSCRIHLIVDSKQDLWISQVCHDVVVRQEIRHAGHIHLTQGTEVHFWVEDTSGTHQLDVLHLHLGSNAHIGSRRSARHLEVFYLQTEIAIHVYLAILCNGQCSVSILLREKEFIRSDGQYHVSTGRDVCDVDSRTRRNRHAISIAHHPIQTEIAWQGKRGFLDFGDNGGNTREA